MRSSIYYCLYLPSFIDEKKSLIKKGLLERISLEGLARMLAIEPYQIYKYMDELYNGIPDNLGLKVLDLPIVRRF